MIVPHMCTYIKGTQYRCVCQNVLLRPACSLYQQSFSLAMLSRPVFLCATLAPQPALRDNGSVSTPHMVADDWHMHQEQHRTYRRSTPCWSSMHRFISG